jgi:hypothetical protein
VSITESILEIFHCFTAFFFHMALLTQNSFANEKEGIVSQNTTVIFGGTFLFI